MTEAHRPRLVPRFRLDASDEALMLWRMSANDFPPLSRTDPEEQPNTAASVSRRSFLQTLGAGAAGLH